MYGSGIKALDDISGEHEANSQSTFVDLNFEVSKHASALEDVSSLYNFVVNLLSFIIIPSYFIFLLH